MGCYLLPLLLLLGLAGKVQMEPHLLLQPGASQTQYLAPGSPRLRARGWAGNHSCFCSALTPTSLPSPGQGSADSHPEVLQAPVGSSIQVQCRYRLQDLRARKVWCRFLQEGCQPLVTSAVDRRAPGSGRTFLTDLGGGLLQVEMVTLQEEDTGEYGCVVEGAAGPQTLHRVSLLVLPPGECTQDGLWWGVLGPLGCGALWEGIGRGIFLTALRD